MSIRRPASLMILLLVGCAERLPSDTTRAACADAADCVEGEVCVGGVCLPPSCGLDQYFDPGAASCLACPSGSVSNGGGVRACTALDCGVDQYWSASERACASCPAGERSDGGAATSCAPIDCAVDTRWDSAERACVACEPGTTSSGGATDTCAPWRCALDEAWSGVARRCEPCGAGTFSEGGAAPCLAIDCPLDTRWSPDDRACVPCGTGETTDGGFSVACIPIDCPRDSFWDPARHACFTCAADTTSPGGSTTACAEMRCERGAFWDRMTGDCSACPEGETSDGGAAVGCRPIDCAAGERWDVASVACAACGSGYTSSGGFVTGCVDVDECASDASACAADAACTNGTGSYTCTCQDGFFGDGFACVPWSGCSPGSRVLSEGTSLVDRLCTSCEDGSFTATVNAATCSAWTDCQAGERITVDGTATTDRLCIDCAADTFSASANQTLCAPYAACPMGLGRVIVDAARDATCVPCDDEAAGTEGTWSTGGGSSCQPWTGCQPGSHVGTQGTASTDRTCATCDGGTHANGPNLDTCSAWTTCAPGEYVSQTGTNVRDRTCSPCASGSYSTTTNAASCTNWSQTSCAQGSGYAAGTSTSNSSCTRCAAGSYATGISACQACNDGYWSGAGAASCGAWSTCSAGQYVSALPSASSDRACTACAGDTFSTTTNAPSCTAWTNCAPATYVTNSPSSTVDRRCAACPSKSYSAGTNWTSCTEWFECAAGYGYTPGDTTHQVGCVPCNDSNFPSPAGAATWSPGGTAYCAAWSSCTAGQYVSSNGTASTDRSCSPCATGYTTTSNALTCTNWSVCGAGSYASTSGTATTDTACTACAPIADCASGPTCTSSSNAVCESCATGYAGSGTSSCSNVSCPAGQCRDGTTCVGAGALVSRTLAGTAFEFSCIPSGSFLMGTANDDPAQSEADAVFNVWGREKPQHPVTLTKSFLLHRTETTQAQYQAVMGANPSTFQGQSYPDAATRPVETLDWYAAMAFCDALSSLEGSPAGTYGLPTEAEWEYAARAGTTEARYGALASVAWYQGNSGAQTHPVKGLPANAWGLYDMLGNAWEFTSENGIWGSYASADPVTDPYSAPWTSNGGNPVMIRGGSYKYGSGFAHRAAWRGNINLNTVDAQNGIRVRRALP